MEIRALVMNLKLFHVSFGGIRFNKKLIQIYQQSDSKQQFSNLSKWFF